MAKAKTIDEEIMNGEDTMIDMEGVETVAVEDPNEKVTIRVPRIHPKEDPNLFVGINGKNYIIPRGKAVKVPRFVKEEIERSEKAKDRFYETVEELLPEEQLK
jgi:hypothetical protein|nr:MAG TPA_asm: hypothetical protein [Caudoviricetes sp.]